MTHKPKGLYLVSTPIGNRGDITLRALSTLSKADLICCEDKRVSAPFLTHFGIHVPLLSYHDHNGPRVRPKILEALSQGKGVCLISDAGTPLISDPGYKLVEACYDLNIPVTTLPGASSILPALLLSGFPPSSFYFVGFSQDFENLQEIPSTLIFFEAPHRLKKTLEKMRNFFPSRHVAVIHELTKKFERVIRGSLDQVILHYESLIPKGEIVIVLSPFLSSLPSDDHIEKALDPLLQNHSLKEASALVAAALGISRKKVYQYALARQSRFE